MISLLHQAIEKCFETHISNKSSPCHTGQPQWELRNTPRPSTSSSLGSCTESCSAKRLLAPGLAPCCAALPDGETPSLVLICSKTDTKNTFFSPAECPSSLWAQDTWAHSTLLPNALLSTAFLETRPEIRGFSLHVVVG